MGKIQGFILYRIYYGETLVYLGRTKQPLQNRIRGHLFKKAMQRSIDINLVTKIEYAQFQSEADMNVYEVYFINLWKPPLNIDDKCQDNLSFALPDVEWKKFETHLWEKWKKDIADKDNAVKMRQEEKAAAANLLRIMHKKWHSGEISEDDYYRYKEAYEKQQTLTLPADDCLI